MTGSTQMPMLTDNAKRQRPMEWEGKLDDVTQDENYGAPIGELPSSLWLCAGFWKMVDWA
jgi:hypothetical protein